MNSAQAHGMPLESHPRLVTDMFEDTVRRRPDWTAIDFMGATTSYRALADAVDRAAAGLQALGVVAGTRVALCLPNTPHYPVLFLATLKAGGVVVNVNPLYVERELRHLLVDSGAEIIATCDLTEVHRRVVGVAAELGLRHVITCPIAEALPMVKSIAYRLFRRGDIAVAPRDAHHLTYAALIAGRSQPGPVTADPHDVAVLQYTGGTTGEPKAAMLSHANLVAQADAMMAHVGGETGEQERVLGVLPLFHVFALTTVFSFSMRVGAEMILLPRYDLKQTLKTIGRARPSFFPAVPTIYGAIAEAALTRSVDLSSIHACISGGAPLPADVREAFESRTKGRLVEGFGLSEASPIITCNPIDGPDKPGSAGPPFPGTIIEIRDPDAPHALRERGVPGEICARGPQVMAGYWHKAEATEATFCEGALRTGDIGYLDEDGYLFIVDRIKDVILCGGYNVYPRIIEEALYEHPDVAEAVVVGVPDPYRGQAPKAFVTLRAGAGVTGVDLRDFLRDKISKIELPRAVEIRDKLPKTLIGKLSKKELVEEERLKAAAETEAAASEGVRGAR
ncbi:long-chain acyl-CoA synthetase [Sphingomonas gellani]|uniref:Long-chain acyl-CoA synthetase n=1 Tax=Sphingomonas gellani TaxID=1166340 RepID=A0A1H8G8F6_9SPHN|nr:long-chain fatty acid--CoA ligase [Sphingomonas gellani]SEN40030.1 long-chain acyl-CoA synthetase [Sphingomonas gellani]